MSGSRSHRARASSPSHRRARGRRRGRRRRPARPGAPGRCRARRCRGRRPARRPAPRGRRWCRSAASISRLPLSLRRSRVVTSWAPSASYRGPRQPGAKSSTSSGVPNGPRRCTSFDSSTTTMKRGDIWPTSFSRVWAPPPPLVRLNAGSTSSAPSMARSSEPISSGVTTAGRATWPAPRSAFDVAVHTMSGAPLAEGDDGEVHGRAGAEARPACRR